MSRYTSIVRDGSTIELRGPGCEGFVVQLPDVGGDARDRVSAALSIANRIETLLEHAHHAGREYARCEVRRAIGVER